MGSCGIIQSPTKPEQHRQHKCSNPYYIFSLSPGSSRESPTRLHKTEAAGRARGRERTHQPRGAPPAGHHGEGPAYITFTRRERAWSPANIPVRGCQNPRGPPAVSLGTPVITPGILLLPLGRLLSRLGLPVMPLRILLSRLLPPAGVCVIILRFAFHPGKECFAIPGGGGGASYRFCESRSLSRYVTNPPSPFR